MNDDQAFARTVSENPNDDAPRLVYSDWLDECGDLRGEFLRLEVQARVSQSEKVAKVDYDRLRIFRAKIDSGWLGDIDRPGEWIASAYHPDQPVKVRCSIGDWGMWFGGSSGNSLSPACPNCSVKLIAEITNDEEKATFRV